MCIHLQLIGPLCSNSFSFSGALEENACDVWIWGLHVLVGRLPPKNLCNMPFDAMWGEWQGIVDSGPPFGLR